MITQLSEKFSGTRKIKRKLSIIMDACLSTFNVPCFKWSFNCVCTFIVHISYVCVCCQDDSSFDGNLSRCHIFWRGSNSVCVCVLTCFICLICVYVCVCVCVHYCCQDDSSFDSNLSRCHIFWRGSNGVRVTCFICFCVYMCVHCICVCIIAVHYCCQDDSSFDSNLSRCHIFWRGSNSVCVCVPCLCAMFVCKCIIAVKMIDPIFWQVCTCYIVMCVLYVCV